MASASQKARERAEARRREIAARQRTEARRRLLLRVLLPVVLVIVVVAVFVVVKVSSGGSKPAAQGVLATGSAPASVVHLVTSIPAATFDSAAVDADAHGPTAVATPTTLTADGKPRVLYVGAEFCPYCAAERWVVVAALSRFGTWSGLGQTNSSATDVYPNTATLSFHGATFTSSYLVFNGYETTDRDNKPLDPVPSADQALVTSLDPKGNIPFQDLGGQFFQVGSSYDPGVLADKTHAQIAQAVTDPTSAIGKLVLAAANLYTARLCQLTGGQPGSVCSSSAVSAAKATL